jgi:hypothetical protein
MHRRAEDARAEALLDIPGWQRSGVLPSCLATATSAGSGVSARGELTIRIAASGS